MFLSDLAMDNSQKKKKKRINPMLDFDLLVYVVSVRLKYLLKAEKSKGDYLICHHSSVNNNTKSK